MENRALYWAALPLSKMRQMARKIRVLIIATNDWCAIGQFLSALIHIGFEIAVVCPSGSPIQHVKNLSARYKYRSWRSQKSIRTAIAKWSPDLLLCNDDIAVRDLHDLHREACTETAGPETSRLLHLIESSFGDSRSFTTSRSKSRLISLAQVLKIACPPTSVVNTHPEIERHFGRLTYPVLVKLDASWGGRGVRLARDDDELQRAVLELSFPHDWPNSIKRAAVRVIRDLSLGWRPPFPQKLNIQRYVSGRPANRAVVCWRGKILSGISVEALETDSEFGPTTLARIIEHPEMAEAAEKIVENQKLSGFLGFDFMLDHTNRAWFLEMNPRVTPACHLRFKAPSLPAALFLELTGDKPSIDVREVQSDVVALFPNRVSKEAAHPYFDDVPEDETAFVNACRRSRFFREIDWREKFDRIASRRFSAEDVTNIYPEGTNDN